MSLPGRVYRLAVGTAGLCRARATRLAAWARRWKPAKANWDDGVEDELRFWRQVLEGSHPPYAPHLEDVRRRLDPDTPLDAWVASLLPPDRPPEQCAILDVAAGPVTSLGWHVRGARPRIVPIDALADRYRALLTEFRCAPPVWTEACDGEAIAARFPPGSFDVAHIRNALDHCYDPLAVLAGALAVLRPGGTLAIAGFKDEAEHGGYDGLHQWNVRGENDDVIVWRPRERHSVRETFAGAIASMTVRQSEASRWVSAVIRKR